jgi:PAS domain S-box-containing protein
MRVLWQPPESLRSSCTFLRACLVCGFAAFLSSLVLLPLARSVPAEAAALRLDALQDRFPVGTHMEILEDPDQKYSIHDVTSLPLSREFRPSPDRVPNLGASSAAFWVRFTLENDTAHMDRWLLVYEMMRVERIDLYIPTGPGTFDHQFAGLSFPLTGREIADPGYMFPLEIPPGTSRTVVMRFEDRSPLFLTLSVWNPDALTRYRTEVRVLFGMALGMLIVLVLHNFVLFVSARDRTYAYYVLFLVTFGMYQAGLLGWSTKYLWPDAPWWAFRSTLYFADLALVFCLLFTRSFLMTREHAPWADRFLTSLAWLGAVTAQIVFVHYPAATLLTDLTAGLTWTAVLLTSVLCVARGYKPARLFLLAWFFFFCGGFLMLLSLGGILDLTEPVRYGFFAGFFIGGMLFSFSLGYRLHSLRNQVLRESRKRQHAEENVRASEEKFRQLVEDIHDVIYETDEKGKITYASPAAESILGVPASDVLGRHVSRFLHTDGVSTLEEELVSILSETPRPHEYRVRDRTGESRWVRTFSRPFFQGEKLAGVRGVLTDITARRRAEEELRRHRDHLEELVEARTAELKTANEDLLREIEQRKRMQEELLKTQKLESLGILAGGIAHDFNNILTAILTNVSLAKRYGNVAEDIYEILTDAEKASLQAKNLTHQLLGFARGGKPVKKPVFLPDLLRDTVEFSLSGSNVRCDYLLPEDLWPVDADPGQIGQVVQNVVINADQAMPAGGTIRVCAENVTVREEDLLPVTPGRYVKITAQDHGVGIPEKDLQNIFDPFFTTKQKGSGIGLTTAFNIVKNHNGTIRVESAPGQGTVFHIFLPALPGAEASGDEGTRKPISGRGTILLMDDEAVILRSAGEVLKRLGYEVAFARDGAEAIERYRQAREEERPFDLVILDLTIRGGMGGREAVVELMKIDPDVKVVVSSGYSRDPVMSDFRAYGFRGVIPKPYRIEEMARVIHDVLNDPES